MSEKYNRAIERDRRHGVNSAIKIIAHCRGDNEQRTSDGFHRISHNAVSEVGMTAVRCPCVGTAPSSSQAGPPTTTRSTTPPANIPITSVAAASRSRVGVLGIVRLLAEQYERSA
jgi:hypothetical protein